jgi:hypothetical protein
VLRNGDEGKEKKRIIQTGSASQLAIPKLLHIRDASDVVRVPVIIRGTDGPTVLFALVMPLEQPARNSGVPGCR